MKKIVCILFLMVSIVPLSAVSQQKKTKVLVPAFRPSFFLHGQLDKSPSSVVYLAYRDGEKECRDTVSLHDGKFQFKGIVQQPVSARLYSDKQDLRVRFWLENTDIQMVSDPKGGYHFIGGMIAKDQQVLDDLLAGFSLREQKAAHDEEKVSLRSARVIAIQKFIQEHPESPISTEQLAALAVQKDADYIALSKLYTQLSSIQQQSVQGKQVIQYVKEQIKKNQPQMAIDFSLENVDGKVVKLSDYKGKYVLLDFWASWCIPCRKENPNVLKAYEAFHDKGLEILAVSLDTDRASWLAAIKQDGLPWEQVSDLGGWKSAPAKLYQVMGIPDNFLIAPDGIILARGLREEKLLHTLKEIFDNK